MGWLHKLLFSAALPPPKQRAGETDISAGDVRQTAYMCSVGGKIECKHNGVFVLDFAER